MSDSSSWSFSLSREEILRRRERRDQISRQIGELQQELEAEDKWFEAISLILPPAFLATVASAPTNGEAGEHRSTWRRAIEPVIGAATKGLLPREVALGIKENGDLEAKERIIRNPNGLYAAVERMIDDGQIVRHGEKLYSAALYQALSASGELEEEVDSELRGANRFIVDAIKQHGPVPPKTIIEMMRGSEEFGEKQRANPQYGYSAIQRAVRQGHVERNANNRYQLAVKENEPSGGETPNGSDAGPAKDIFS